MTGRYELSSQRWALIEDIASPPRPWAVLAGMIDRCSMVCSESFAPAPNGVIYPNATALGKRSISIFANGGTTERLSAY